MARVVGVAVEDVLVARLRRRHPDVRVLEAARRRVLEVAVDDRVVDERALPLRLGAQLPKCEIIT